MPNPTASERLTSLREQVISLEPGAVNAAISPNKLAEIATSAALATFGPGVGVALEQVRAEADEVNDRSRRWAAMQRVRAPRTPLDTAKTLDNTQWRQEYTEHMRDREIPSVITLLEEFGIDYSSTLPAYYPQSVLTAAILYPEGGTFGLRRDRKLYIPLAAIVDAGRVARWVAQFPELSLASLAQIIRKHRQNPGQVPEAAQARIDARWESRARRIAGEEA